MDNFEMVSVSALQMLLLAGIAGIYLPAFGAPAAATGSWLRLGFVCVLSATECHTHPVDTIHLILCLS